MLSDLITWWILEALAVLSQPLYRDKHTCTGLDRNKHTCTRPRIKLSIIAPRGFGVSENDVMFNLGFLPDELCLSHNGIHYHAELLVEDQKHRLLEAKVVVYKPGEYLTRLKSYLNKVVESYNPYGGASTIMLVIPMIPSKDIVVAGLYSVLRSLLDVDGT